MIFVGCVRERFEPGSPWGFASATENICILKRNRPKKRSLELQKRPGRVWPCAMNEELPGHAFQVDSLKCLPLSQSGSLQSPNWPLLGKVESSVMEIRGDPESSEGGLSAARGVAPQHNQGCSKIGKHFKNEIHGGSASTSFVTIPTAQGRAALPAAFSDRSMCFHRICFPDTSGGVRFPGPASACSCPGLAHRLSLVRLHSHLLVA